MEFLIAVLNSTGLILDIIGACLIFYYVFDKPDPLRKQETIKTIKPDVEFRDGKEVHVIRIKASMDMEADFIDEFNDYKDWLFRLRARFGLYCLILGFLVQIISSFGRYLDASSVFFVATIDVVFVVCGVIYVFVYLINFTEKPGGSKRALTVEATPVGKRVEIKTTAEPEFWEWSNQILKYRTRMNKTGSYQLWGF